ncbi:MAG: hypothetical protein II629_05445 [Ruminococcus sp.]|nr:hypothetical protein [Ruminococcus sp.]
MDYKGIKCPVCQRGFSSNDDIVVCPRCGAVYERYKRSALIDHPERYRCGKCRQPMVGAGVFYR